MEEFKPAPVKPGGGLGVDSDSNDARRPASETDKTAAKTVASPETTIAHLPISDPLALTADFKSDDSLAGISINADSSNSASIPKSFGRYRVMPTVRRPTVSKAGRRSERKGEHMGTNSLKIVLIKKDGEEKPEDMSVGDSITILLDGSERIYIGRAPDADVLVQAPSVGRKVVALWLGPDGVVVKDLGSGCGSLLEVSGVQTHRPSGLLPDKAILWIGRVAFRVELAGEQ